MTTPTSKIRRNSVIGLASLIVATSVGVTLFLTKTRDTKEAQLIQFLPPYLGNPSEAEAKYVQLSRSITKTATFQRYVTLRTASRSAESFPELLRIAEEIKGHHPNSSFAHFLVGFTHYRNPIVSSKPWNEISFRTEGLKKGDGTSPPWNGISGSRYYLELDFENRIILFTNWLKATRPSREEYSRTLTPHALHLDKAKTSFEKAIDLDSSNILALWHLGRTYEYLGLIEEALETHLALIEASPNFNMGYIGAARHLQIRGDTEKAIKILSDGLREIPYDSWITHDLGKYLFEKGSTEESKRLLQTYLDESGEKSLSLENRGIWTLLAKIAEAQGNTERSEQIRKQLETD